jgi:hypothetical protein
MTTTPDTRAAQSILALLACGWRWHRSRPVRSSQCRRTRPPPIGQVEIIVFRHLTEPGRRPGAGEPRGGADQAAGQAWSPWRLPNATPSGTASRLRRPGL